MYERQTGKRPDALNTPPLPAVLEHVWGWFLGLHRRRRIGSIGPEPIDDVVIHAWATVRRIRMLPVEVAALTLLDDLYFQSIAEARKGNKE